MTRTLLSALVLFATLSAFSQITIESVHMPKARDTFRFITGNPVGYNDQIALNGANKTWVFNETLSPVTNLVEYKNSLATPYAFFFLNTVGLLVTESSGLGQFQLEDVYQFYSTNASSYRIEGMGLKISLAPAPLAGNYQVEDKVYHFPLEYQDRDSSGFKVKLQIPLLGSYSQSGFRITEVVGYGNVIIVDDTFACLKVKSTIVGADSVETQFAKFGFPTRRIEYKWLTTEHRIPVAEITGSEVAGNFVPAMVRHLDIAPDTGTGGGGGGGTNSLLPPADQEVLFYPNPAREQLVFSDEVGSFQCFNMWGKEMLLEGEGSLYQTGKLPPGTYLLRLQLKDGRESIQPLLIVR